VARLTSSAARRSVSAPRLDSDASRRNQKQGGEEQFSSPHQLSAHPRLLTPRSGTFPQGGRSSLTEGRIATPRPLPGKRARSSLTRDRYDVDMLRPGHRYRGRRRPASGRLLVRHRCNREVVRLLLRTDATARDSLIQASQNVALDDEEQPRNSPTGPRPVPVGADRAAGRTAPSIYCPPECQGPHRRVRPRLPVRPGDAALRRRRRDGRPPPLATNP